jgi:hypothetical protein
MEEHKMSCGHSTSEDDMCSACFDEAIELLTAFVVNRRLEVEGTETYLEAQKFIQKHGRWCFDNGK